MRRKKFYIREVANYTVEAETAEEALQKHLAASSEERDATLDNVEERTIEDGDTGEVTEGA